MNNCCYTIAIRQRRCENGIPRQFDNVYTNATLNSVFPLSFGYSVTFTSISRNYITIRISNPNFIPDINFNIPLDNYNIFDLPIETGSLRVYIGAIAVNCSCQSSNNTCCSAF